MTNVTCLMKNVGPILKKHEEESGKILDKSSQLLSEIIEYRDSLDDIKTNYVNRIELLAAILTPEDLQ